MTTPQWMAAFFGFTFVVTINLTVKLNRIANALEAINSRVDVRIVSIGEPATTKVQLVNTGLNTTNYSPWQLENHQ